MRMRPVASRSGRGGAGAATGGVTSGDGGGPGGDHAPRCCPGREGGGVGGAGTGGGTSGAGGGWAGDTAAGGGGGGAEGGVAKRDKPVNSGAVPSGREEKRKGTRIGKYPLTPTPAMPLADVVR